MDQSTQSSGGGAAGSDTLRQSDDERAASLELSLRSLETPGVSPGYEIIRRLGTGSFGAVWLAREVKTGKQVAIKFYTHRRGLDWSLLTREVEKLAVLYTSRDIVGLLDVGWDHDPPYFVMEFLERGSLQMRLQQGRLPVETAARIATSIARALVHAHGSGILHCDLKPANILLDGNEEPRLGDFGQSRLTTEQSPALGTMYYMAPEQADLNAVPDARWDVYALGSLLYEMLTGAPPYRTDDAERRLRSAASLEDRLAGYRRIIVESPRPKAHREVKGVDKRLAAIVDGCLRPDPGLRLPNAQVVFDKLDQRNAARSRRPLIALGFLGPILFMLAMFWIAGDAVPQAVTAAQHSLIDRALAGDSVSALILADSIQRDLAARQEQVQNLADMEAARTIARVLDKHPEWHAEQNSALSEDGAQESNPRRDFLLSLIEGRNSDDPAQPAYVELAAAIDANEARLNQEKRTPDTGWFIVGAQGRQVFRLPVLKKDGQPQKTIGESFHWRGYYTGLDADLSKDPRIAPFESVSPRTTPGICQPFRSEATNQYMIAIVAPIWDVLPPASNDQEQQGAQPRAVIGVIASMIHISELLKQWEHTIRDPDEAARDPDEAAGANDRFLALATFRETAAGGEARLLDHPWMTTGNLRQVAPSDDEDARNKDLDEFMSEMRITDNVNQELAALAAGDRRDLRDSQYMDPFRHRAPEFDGEWLAAFARVGQTDWIAIVQERRDTAIEPIQKVNGIFARAGVVAIVVFGVLLAILWYFLNRASSST